MFRKTLSILITLLFSFSVLASPNSGVKAAFDEYIYSMEVEGGSLDHLLAQRAQERLQADLDILIQEGISRKELLQESIGLVKNDRLRKELEASLAQFDDGSISEASFLEQLHTSFDGNYNKGASWNGSVLHYTLLPLIIVVAVLVVYKAVSSTTQCLGSEAEKNPKCQAYYEN